MGLENNKFLVKLENTGVFQNNKWLVKGVSLEVEKFQPALARVSVKSVKVGKNPTARSAENV